MLQIHIDTEIQVCVTCQESPHIFYEAPKGMFGWHFQIYCPDCSDEKTDLNQNTVLLRGMAAWNKSQIKPRPSVRRSKKS